METAGSGFIDATSVVPAIDTTLCSGCGRCVAACPLRLITLEVSGFRKNASLKHPERCNSCGRCLKACPVTAILWCT